MRQLRDPDTGCPWDVEQTFASIAPYTVEEAYEVADAIARDNLTDLVDELGDLLLQVVFHARMAEEAGAFAFGDVVEAIVEKMIRRHPHVFGEQQVASAEEQTRNWEDIKARERGSDASALAGVANGLAPLVRASKLQRRAARVGFDWPDASGVFAKLAEESAELREAHAHGDADAVEHELGDLLFTCVNLARHLDVDPEQALLRANLRFERRFRHMEARHASALDAPASSGQAPEPGPGPAGGKRLSELSVEELEQLWVQAKVATQ